VGKPPCHGPRLGALVAARVRALAPWPVLSDVRRAVYTPDAPEEEEEREAQPEGQHIAVLHSCCHKQNRRGVCRAPLPSCVRERGVWFGTHPTVARRPVMII
jgi:hypothetical protein